MHIQGYMLKSMKYMAYYFIYEIWFMQAMNSMNKPQLDMLHQAHSHARYSSSPLSMGQEQMRHTSHGTSTEKHSTLHWVPANLSGTVSLSVAAWRVAEGSPWTEAPRWGLCTRVNVGQLRGLSERGRWAGGWHGANITHWMPLWDVIDPFLLLTGGNLHNRPAKPVTVGSFKIKKVFTNHGHRCQHKTLEPPLESVTEVLGLVCVCACVCVACRPAVMVSLSNKEWIRLLITPTDM